MKEKDLEKSIKPHNTAIDNLMNDLSALEGIDNLDTWETRYNAFLSKSKSLRIQHQQLCNKINELFGANNQPLIKEYTSDLILNILIDKHNQAIDLERQKLDGIKKYNMFMIKKLAKSCVESDIQSLKKVGPGYNQKAIILSKLKSKGKLDKLDTIKNCTDGLNEFLQVLDQAKKRFVLDMLHEELTDDEFDTLFPGFTSHNSLGREPNPIAPEIPRFTTIKSIKGGIEESIVQKTPDFTTDTDDFSSTYLLYAI